MANHFHDLSTDSTGEKRSGNYWQSNRAKGETEKIRPGNHPSPDSGRTDLAAPNTPLDKGAPASPTPQFEPTV